MSNSDEKMNFLGQRILQILMGATDLLMGCLDHDDFDDLQMNGVKEQDGQFYRIYYGIEGISEEEARRMSQNGR